ncbi:MAG TPA: hypothetical protein VGM59_05500 [Dongiaceae bacterium]
MSAPSSAKASQPLVPYAVSCFLARMALAGFAVLLLALTGHA